MSPTASFASTPLVKTTSATDYWDASEVAYMTEIEAEFRTLNPEATDEQVEDYIKGNIHQSVIDSMNANANPELLPYLVADLNEVEKALYFENTAVGDAVLYEAMTATNAANATGLPADHNDRRLRMSLM